MKKKSKKLKLLAGVTAITLCSSVIASTSYSASANPIWNRFKALFTRSNNSSNISGSSNLKKASNTKNETGCFDRIRNLFKSSPGNIDGEPRNHKKRTGIDKNDIVVIVNNDPEMNKLHTPDFKKKIQRQIKKNEGEKGALYRVLKFKNYDPERKIVNRLFIRYMDIDSDTSDTSKGAAGGFGVSKTNLGGPVYQNIDADGNPIGDKPEGTYPITNIHITSDKSKDSRPEVIYASLKFKKTKDQSKIHGADDKVEYIKVKKQTKKDDEDNVIYAKLDLNKPVDPNKIHGKDDKVIYSKIKKHPKKSDPVYQNIDADGNPIGDKPYGTFPVSDKHIISDQGKDQKGVAIDYERLGARPKTKTKDKKPTVTPRSSVLKKSSDDDKGKKPIPTPRTSIIKKSTDKDTDKKPPVAPKPVVIKTSIDKPEDKKTVTSRKTIFISGSTDTDKGKKPQVAPKPAIIKKSTDKPDDKKIMTSRKTIFIKGSTDTDKDKKPPVAPKPVVIKTSTDKPDDKKIMTSTKSIFIKGSTDEDKKPVVSYKPKFTIKTSTDSDEGKQYQTRLTKKTIDSESGVTSGSVKARVRFFEGQ